MLLSMKGLSRHMIYQHVVDMLLESIQVIMHEHWLKLIIKTMLNNKVSCHAVIQLALMNFNNLLDSFLLINA